MLPTLILFWCLFGAGRPSFFLLLLLPTYQTYLHFFLTAYLKREDLAYGFFTYRTLIELIRTYFRLFQSNK